jgi:hypothetical protein
VKISWSQEAATSYQKTIDFILEQWPIEIAEKPKQKLMNYLKN